MDRLSTSSITRPRGMASVALPAWALALMALTGVLAATQVMAAPPASSTPPVAPVAPVPQSVPIPSPSATRAAFEAADLDHDGFISLAEFHKNALQAWHALDRDGDGFISREELAPLPRTLRQSLLGSLRRADSDGDLRLSFKEVMAARMADFDAADTNGDDRLSLAEVLAFEARQREARRR